MTIEEEKEFREKIVNTILPIVNNMTEDQIRNIIKAVEKDNNHIQKGFGDMLFQQIMVHKYNKLNKF